jgi:hypothetical protein
MNAPSRLVALVLGGAAALAALPAAAVPVPEPAPHTTQEPALTPQQAILWKYTARCALRPDQELETPPGTDGKTLLFKGALGLAPEWREGKCDATCQEKVSSCLAALTNQTGDHVNLSLMSAAPSLSRAMGPSENDLVYPFQEGAFFGNVFAGEAFVCRGRDADKGAQLKRFCALTPGLCSGIATFADAGSCAESCRMSCTTLSDGSRRCAAVSCRDPKGRTWNHPITTYLRNRIEAGNADALVGAVARDSTLEDIQDGGEAVYRRVDFASGPKGPRAIVANISAPTGGGQIEVWLAGGKRLAVMTVAGTGGAARDIEAPLSVSGVSGQRDIVLRFKGLHAGVRVTDISLR